MPLIATNITAGYETGHTVVDGVSLTLPRAEIVGLTGASGCGKSTLARVLADLHRPWSGTVSIDDHPLRGRPFSAPPPVRGAVAMLFQSPRAATDPRMTLSTIINQPRVIAGHRTNETEIIALAERVGLTPDLLTRRPDEVSEGQLQRACIARALAQRPRYLICDEATAMFDPGTTAAIIRLILEVATDPGLGILLISHDHDLLESCCTTIDRLTPSVR
ncbi:ABC transporter ATP-binding protein [Rhodococcus sp. NPDC057529]|uniref:ABC transporter ATP-binding protein n=1 Tax=Rhodococcus sp. NPDC057529 TaxID=3346158 RepID=UPI00366FD690